MSRNVVRITGALVLSALLLLPLAALAHEEVTAGNYVIEYGWVNEPPVVGQPNGIVINISGKPAGAGHSHDTGSISIVTPADGATIAGDSVEVAIKTEGVENPDGLHWHLYVNDEELAMIPLDETSVTLTGLSNGMHAIKVAIAASDHSEIGQPAEAMLMVEGSSASGEMMVTGMEPASGDHSHDEGIDVDVSGLTVEIEYGGQSKTLELDPLAGGAPGQFVAPLTPTRAGQYTLKLGGKLTGSLGDADVSASVEPEEVPAADPNAFPAPESSAQSSPAGAFGPGGWLSVVAIVAGGLGLGLSVVALARKR